MNAIFFDRLGEGVPGRKIQVFSGTAGSEASEPQAKLVWHRNDLQGKPQKMIISRQHEAGAEVGKGFPRARREDTNPRAEALLPAGDRDGA